MKEFTHDGDDDLLGLFAVGDETIGEGFEQRVEAPGIHGGQEESASERSGADLGDGGVGSSRGSADEVPGRDADPCGELPGVVEELDGWKLRQEDLTGSLPQAGDADEKLVLMSERVIARDDLADAQSQVLNFLFLGLDASA